MSRRKLKHAIAEAERFIDRARVALVSTDTPPSLDDLRQSKHNATAMRASMDLSRALSDLRNTRT